MMQLILQWAFFIMLVLSIEALLAMINMYRMFWATEEPSFLPDRFLRWSVSIAFSLTALLYHFGFS